MRVSRFLVVVSLLALVPVVQAGPAHIATPELRLVRVASGLDNPVEIGWRAGDTRKYIAEQSGRIRIVDNAKVVGTALDITASVSTGGEQGLLGIAFSLDGKKLYADFTDVRGDTHVMEWTM